MPTVKSACPATIARGEEVDAVKRVGNLEERSSKIFDLMLE